MPDQHARVTASGFERWTHCPGSVAIEEQFPDTGSEAAAEGTRAHSAAEKKLQIWKETGKRERVDVDCDDETMQEATDNYRDYVIEIFNVLKTRGLNPQLDIEVREDLSDWIPEGFGTSDAVISSFEELHIIDLKYGKGVEVSAHNNGQLRLYALGAVKVYWDLLEFETVTMHIFQPRLNNFSSETMTVKDLLAWGETVKPTARKAYDGTGELKAGNWCKFCRAKNQCKKRAETMFGPYEANPDLNLLSIEEMATTYTPELLDEICDWAKGIKDFYLSKALEGVKIPGHKLIESRSNRKITDPEGFAAKMQQSGYTEEQIWKPKELKTLTAFKKLIGDKKLNEDYSQFMVKPPGKPTLVPEDREGKEWKPAEAMFGPAKKVEE